MGINMLDIINVFCFLFSIILTIYAIKLFRLLRHKALKWIMAVCAITIVVSSITMVSPAWGAYPGFSFFVYLFWVIGSAGLYFWFIMELEEPLPFLQRHK